MKLKAKNFKWLAGRPVVILNEKTAKKLNVFQNDRVALFRSHKFYAIVDIFPKLVKHNEIGLSFEVTKALNIKNNMHLDVSASELSNASELIKKKINCEKLNKQEYEIIISEIVKNNLTEAEIAYFVAGQKLCNMDIDETIELTQAMVDTGESLHLDKKFIVDKHCIGGIAGNRTTPIVVSICAAAGLTFPKTSSRAITSAAGTANVIETIANVELSMQDLKNVINKVGACLIWGGGIALAPSDDKIIQVERMINIDVESQLLASIMSKKISIGSKYLLIDIPYGEGGKMRTLSDAKKLGEKFRKLCNFFKIKIDVVYTDGTQPIGNGIGPVLEMMDVLRVLRTDEDAPQDLINKALFLSSRIMNLCGIKNPEQKAKEILYSGLAYKKFQEIINAQNKSNDFDKRIANLRLGHFKKTIFANKDGKIFKINNKEINSICRMLGTPETISAGVYLHKHVGGVKKGEPIITFYSESEMKLHEAIDYFNKRKTIEVR